jgi:LDH2 family malate/lactate/ureidoglycolate dehydrogenase
VYSHGVMRVPHYLAAVRAGKVKPGVRSQILSETKTTAVIDGCLGFGQVVCREAMSLAVQKALEQGIAAVTVHNSNHSGCIASYSKQAAAQGLIGIVMVNAGGGGQSVAPFGGLARRLATNPLSIAAPSGNGFPIVLDIATSVAPEGKVRACFQSGKPVPAGWIADSQGRPTTAPQDFYDGGGFLLPLGGAAGYKGFGLAFMIDILAGALSGAGCCRPGVTEPRDGLLMIAISIKHFIPMANFYQQVASLVAHVKSCPAQPGVGAVFVPGELEFHEEQRRRAEGIELDPATWRLIQEAAGTVGLTLSASAVADC